MTFKSDYISHILGEMDESQVLELARDALYATLSSYTDYQLKMELKDKKPDLYALLS